LEKHFAPNWAQPSARVTPLKPTTPGARSNRASVATTCHLTPVLSTARHLHSDMRHLPPGLHAQCLQQLPRVPYPLTVGPKEKPIPSSSCNFHRALVHSALPLAARICSKRRALATEQCPRAPASPPLGAQVPDLTPTAAGSSSTREGRAPQRGPATLTLPRGHLRRHDLRPDLRAYALYLLSG
jgi:hypothetical protein